MHVRAPQSGTSVASTQVSGRPGKAQLGEDVTRILTDQTNTRLAELFADWRSDGDGQQTE